MISALKLANLHLVEIENRRFVEIAVDFDDAVVAGNGHKRDIGALQLLRSEASPFPHALENQFFEQRLLRLRGGPQALVLDLRHRPPDKSPCCLAA